MKPKLPALLPLFWAFVILPACQKPFTSDETPLAGVINPADTTSAKSAAELTQTAPYPQSGWTGCENAPDYGDSIVYPQPTNGNDFYTSPLNNKGVAGTYIAWPGGLVIDPSTGTIDLTRSETGQKYAIGFIKAGSTDTCMTALTIAGADYIDSVYVSSASSKSAAPHFNANPNGPNPCAGSGCDFDYDHTAKHMGVYIDNHKGSIDIKNTLQHSLFALFPFDGNYFYTTINYKADDATNHAPQSIQVKLIYYNHKADIPPSLLNTVSTRANGTITGTLSTLGQTRPPIIIITRTY